MWSISTCLQSHTVYSAFFARVALPVQFPGICALREGNDAQRTENRSQGFLAPLASMCKNCTSSTRRHFYLRVTCREHQKSHKQGVYALPRHIRKALSRWRRRKNRNGECAAKTKQDKECRRGAKIPAPENGSRECGSGLFRKDQLFVLLYTASAGRRSFQRLRLSAAIRSIAARISFAEFRPLRACSLPE